MSTASFPSVSVPAGPAIAAESLWRLSVAQYHDMIRLGILAEDAPVELIDGYLVEKMPRNPPHVLSTQLVRIELEKRLPVGWHLRVQEPVTLADSEPEPDLVVAAGHPRDYPARHPGAAEIALLVEVADATLTRDQGPKKRLYARAGVPVYWIVNLIDRRVEVHEQPAGDDYAVSHEFGTDAEIPLVIAGTVLAAVAVRDLLP